MYKTTKVSQTLTNHEVDLSILKAMCYHAARLYNVALYSIRQHYFNIVFSGKRTHRGLYRSSDGLYLNADINDSINILRKYFNERNGKWLYQDSVRALVNVPCRRLNVFAQAPSFRWV